MFSFAANLDAIGSKGAFNPGDHLFQTIFLKDFKWISNILFAVCYLEGSYW